MRISSHRLLIQAVTEAVSAVCTISGDAFSRGLCFGYACTFVEAIFTETLGPFYARMQGVLDETSQARQRFFWGMALHQSPDKFPEQFPPKTNLTLQNICLSSALLIRGGLCHLMQHAGCYDVNGLKDSLSVIHHMLNQFHEEATFLLIGGAHTIALHMQPSRACIAATINPMQPKELCVQQENDLLILAREMLALLSSVTCKEVSPKLENHLVITWQWVCCHDDLTNKIALRNTVKNHPLFQQNNTLPLAGLPDTKGQSWILAVLKSQELSLIQAMLTLHPSLKQAKEIGLGLITLAVYYHLPEALHFLLKEGFDPNALDEKGFRPLHYAVLNCDIIVLKLLLEFGADKSLPSTQGLKPLTYSHRLMRQANDPSVQQKYKEIINTMTGETVGFMLSH